MYHEDKEKQVKLFVNFQCLCGGWHDILQFRGAPVIEEVPLHLNFFPWPLAEDTLSIPRAEPRGIPSSHARPSYFQGSDLQLGEVMRVERKS